MFNIKLVSASTNNGASPCLCAFLSCSAAVWEERVFVHQIHINMMVESGTRVWKYRHGRKQVKYRECGLRVVRSTESLKTFRAKMALENRGLVFYGCN